MKEIPMNSEFRRHIGSTLAVAALATGLAIAGTAAPSFAQDKTVMVGGAAMYPSKNIVENAVHSKDHTTLVAAVKAAGLVDTLEGKGPFTVFAPTNAAFGKKLKTVEGEELTVKKSGDSVMIVDAKGGSSTVTIPNVNQSNGVIHVVDTVLMPT